MNLYFEALKILAPIAVSYIALLRTRVELDILYAKHREALTGEPNQMRKRWYHVLRRRRVSVTEGSPKQE